MSANDHPHAPEGAARAAMHATGMHPPDAVPLQALLLGKAVPYTRPGSRSGIAKRAASGAVPLGVNGFQGDEQGDPRVHGGPDKAVHHYPADHYADWRSELPGHALLDAPGAFGENLSTLGWTEHNVCIGDVVQVGGAILELSQGRQPCWKLDDRFAQPGMARRVQASGRTGWYYRVRQPGLIASGDLMTIVERPFADWPLRRLLDLLYRRMLDRDLLEQAATLPLPASWMRLIQNRLQSSSVEAWESRLEGPARDAGTP